MPFSALTTRYFPDHGKTPDIDGRFKEIAEAFAVLHDLQKRAEYDAGGHVAVAGYSCRDLFAGMDFDRIFQGLGAARARFDLALFLRLFGDGFRSQRVRGADVRLSVDVPLKDVARGGERRIRLVRPARCPLCDGAGTAPGTEARLCTACHGSGRHVHSGDEPREQCLRIESCAACGGRGRIIDHPCSDCDGAGMVRSVHDLTIAIPPGVEEGATLCLPGHGCPAGRRDAPSGDLFVVVHTRPDRHFRRDGANLWTECTVPVTDAVLGTKIRIKTLSGLAQVAIPAGTQPGEVLTVRGMGLPRQQARRESGGSARGDLFVTVRVDLPVKVQGEQRHLFERLRALDDERPHGG